jgi:aspartate/methionine/tyrosine aminotransferase
MGDTDNKAKMYNDVINFSLGDPDLITDEYIINNAFADARAGHTKYTDFRGDPELIVEICKFYNEEYEVEVANEEVFVSASGCIAMYLVLEAILDDGDEVLMEAPYFTPYEQQVILARGVPIELPTYEEEDFQINIKILEGLISDKTKAIIVNSPSNPTGSVLTVENMKEIIRIAKKHDLVIISDEIYTAYSFERKFVPFLALEGAKERTITINSFSKNFIMTGWRIGNVVAPNEIVQTIQMINENVVFTAPSISQRAAIHALRNRANIQPKIIEEYKSRMFYAAGRVNKIKNMSVINPPKGSFYLFINIKDTKLLSQEVTKKLLEEAHILMIPGNGFGKCGEGYVRMACTTGVEVMEEAFDRIERMSIFGAMNES